VNPSFSGVTPTVLCAAGVNPAARPNPAKPGLYSGGRGAWRSLVSALVWGTRGPEFKSRRPDSGEVLRRSVGGRPRAPSPSAAPFTSAVGKSCRLMSNSRRMTTDEVRDVARAVAAELRGRDVHGSPITVVTSVREERPKGLFGRKTEVITRRVERIAGQGWWLYRQPRTSKTFQGGSSTESLQLWLESDGELLAAEVHQSFDSLTGSETSVVVSVRTASDSDLTIPCHRWEAFHLPPGSRSSSWLWDEVAWTQLEPICAPYEETARLIREVAGRSTSRPLARARSPMSVTFGGG
jgi:hypothetical protein